METDFSSYILNDRQEKKHEMNPAAFFRRLTSAGLPTSSKSRLFYSQVMPLLLITSDNSLDEKQEALALQKSIHRTHLFNLLRRFTKLIFLFFLNNAKFEFYGQNPRLLTGQFKLSSAFFSKFQLGNEPVFGKHV